MEDYNPKISLILPTYNESECILKMIEEAKIGLKKYNFEIIVVDDNSPDQTWKIVKDLNDPNIKVIRRISVSGLASALVRGISESSGDILIWLDCDMISGPKSFDSMIQKTKDYDLILASRYVTGSLDLRPNMRIITSRWMNSFAKLILGYGIKDYDSGFIVCRRSVLDNVIIIPRGYGQYCIELVYQCCKYGLKVIEMPYTLDDRDAGVSKSSTTTLTFLKLGLQYGLAIFKIKIKYLFK